MKFWPPGTAVLLISRFALRALPHHNRGLRALERTPNACIASLGVFLTKETKFHTSATLCCKAISCQYSVYSIWCAVLSGRILCITVPVYCTVQYNNVIHFVTFVIHVQYSHHSARLSHFLALSEQRTFDTKHRNVVFTKMAEQRGECTVLYMYYKCDKVYYIAVLYCILEP